VKPLKETHTRELLAMLKSTRQYGSSRYYPCYPSDAGSVSVEELKAELALREHIPNKAEAKKLRQEAAKEKRNR